MFTWVPEIQTGINRLEKQVFSLLSQLPALVYRRLVAMWSLELNNDLLRLMFKSIKTYCSILHLEWIFMCASVRSGGTRFPQILKGRRYKKL